MVAGSPMSSRNTVTSMSSEKRLIRPKPLDREVPPLKRRRGPPSFRPLNKASSVQQTQKSFSIFWDAVPRRSAVVSKALNIASDPAARTSSKAGFMSSPPGLRRAWRLVSSGWSAVSASVGRRQRDADHRHRPSYFVDDDHDLHPHDQHHHDHRRCADEERRRSASMSGLRNTHIHVGSAVIPAVRSALRGGPAVGSSKSLASLRLI